MIHNTNQKLQAEQFYELHHSNKMLVFPNVWDPLGAILMQRLNYSAIATASASIAYANGYNDGENIPFSDVLIHLSKIVNSVSIPVTADIESAYANNEKQLQENIKLLIATGIVGVNIEDTNKETTRINSIENQCNTIQIIKKVASEMGIPLFINARTDVYIHGDEFISPAAKLEETLKRGLAYKNAGADCFFPIAMRLESDIQHTVEQLQMPINILILPGVPELKILNKIGVARVSLGPALLKIAIKAMKDLAQKLANFEGLAEITNNEITSDYLKDLVNKNY